MSYMGGVASPDEYDMYHAYGEYDMYHAHAEGRMTVPPEDYIFVQSKETFDPSSCFMTMYKDKLVIIKPNVLDEDILYPHDMIYDYFEPLYEEILRR